jgi:hypothetical protein
MAVDDPGRRRQQGGDAAQRRFEPLCLRRGQPLQIVDSICAGRIGYALDARDLALLGGNDQFADLLMRDAMLAAIGVQTLTPRDTAARL